MEKITEDQMEKLEKLYKEHAEVYNEAQDKFAELRRKGKDEMIERENPDGEMQQIRLYDCLEEARIKGWGSAAGQALKREYPDLYDSFQKQQELKAEIKDFAKGELGVNPFELSLLDVIKVARAVD